MFNTSVGTWVTDSQDIAVKEPKIISFEIYNGCENHSEYIASCEEGMTWRKFINSEYYDESKGEITIGDPSMYIMYFKGLPSFSYIHPDDEIINGEKYIFGWPKS